MTTRPTDTPDWATAPTPPQTDVEKPGTGLRSIGWANLQRPPAEFVNWAWNRFADWAAHFASSASMFPTLEGAANAPAAAPLVVGDSCLINEPDGGLPGAVTVAVLDATFTGGPILDLGGDGVMMAGVVAGAGRLRLVERDGSGLIREYTFTNASTFVAAIVYDGAEVVASYNDGATNSIEKWDAVTGVSQWVITHVIVAGTVQSMAWDDSQIYVAIATLTAPQILTLARATGATNWTFDHGNTLHSIVTNGLLVFAQGAVSGFASAATLRGIVASNGFDATNEGGNGADAVNAWDAVQVTPSLSASTIAIDNKILWTPDGADLESRSPAVGAIRQSITLTNAVSGFAVDQSYLFVFDSVAGLILSFEKSTLIRSWHAPSTAGGLKTDGAALFSGTGGGGSRVARGNQPPALFRRVDPSTETWLSLRQLLVPVSRG